MKLHRHETLEVSDFILSEMFRLSSKKVSKDPNLKTIVNIAVCYPLETSEVLDQCSDVYFIPCCYQDWCHNMIAEPGGIFQVCTAE